MDFSSRIALLICYFGKEPWYFKFFVVSCRNNPSITFFIITDMDFGGKLPENIIVVKMTLGEVENLATEKLGFTVPKLRPYKLCDFKPVYGLIFSNLIEEYDFWGYGDIDVIFGNIRSFMTDEVLSRYDVLSLQSVYLTGYFALFKNNEFCVNLFKRSKDFKKVFVSEENYCFDETNWQWGQLMDGQSIFQLKCEVESMTYVVKKLQLCGELRASFENRSMELVPGRLCWSDMGLFYAGKQEFLLYHFSAFKDLLFKYIPEWKKFPARIYINTFYISKYSRWSAAGLLMGVFMVLARGGHYLLTLSREYISWAFKYFRSSGGETQIPNLQEVAGTYRFEYTTIELVSQNGGIYADWDGMKIGLRHLEANKFVPDRFRIGEFKNIGVNFLPDLQGTNYALQVTAFRKEDVIFSKVK
jgi:hypothetical protein